MFQRTTAINKLRNLTKRKRIIQGGTWAGKTYGIIPVLINDALSRPKQKITVVAESIPAIKKGALSDFINIMQDTNRWNDGQYNATERFYIYGNGSRIEFESFETAGKAKAAGKRDQLFINEANYITFDIADTLMMRTSGNIWIDFNPTLEFWAHKEIKPQKDAEFLVLKYTDNEACPETIKEELLMKLEKAKTSTYWTNWCKVYIDGEIGTLQGVVFDNWSVYPNEELPGNLLGYGIDFGFTHSPTAIIQVNESDGNLYVKELLYQTQMQNDAILAFVIKNLDTRAQAIADSADPKTIEYLHKGGWHGLKGSIKGQDSIEHGLNLLLERKIFVTQASLNLINEFRHYMWDETKEGQRMNKPVKAFDHGIDALRYIYSYPRKKQIFIA